jgi:hypothetical protein
LTKWEGTRWAKERFERDQGIHIRDTTADGMPNYADPSDPYSAQALRARTEALEDPMADGEEARHDEEAEVEADLYEESDGELESVGVALNERLRQRVAMRNMSGDNSMPLDEEWENWLKHAIESGELPHVADQIARFPGPHSTLTADDIFPPRMIAAARAGRWEEIPDFLHQMIRQTLGSGRRTARATMDASSSPSSRPAVRYPDILSTLSGAAVYDQQRTRSDLLADVPSNRSAAPSESRA